MVFITQFCLSDGIICYPFFYYYYFRLDLHLFWVLPGLCSVSSSADDILSGQFKSTTVKEDIIAKTSDIEYEPFQKLWLPEDACTSCYIPRLCDGIYS